MKSLYENILSSTKTGLGSIKEKVNEWFIKSVKPYSSGNPKITDNFYLILSKSENEVGNFISLSQREVKIPSIVKLGEINELFIDEDLYKQLYNKNRIVGPIKKITISNKSKVLSDIKIDVVDICSLSGDSNKLKNIEINFKNKDDGKIIFMESSCIEELKHINSNCKSIICNENNIYQQIIDVLKDSPFGRDVEVNRVGKYYFSKGLSDFLTKNLNCFKNLERLFIVAEEDSNNLHLFKKNNKWYKL